MTHKHWQLTMSLFTVLSLLILATSACLPGRGGEEPEPQETSSAEATPTSALAAVPTYTPTSVTLPPTYTPTPPEGDETVVPVTVTAVVTPTATVATTKVPAAPQKQVVGELLVNGDFEEPFTPQGTGTGWEKFDNGGGVQFFWGDNDWLPAVAHGEHSQGMKLTDMVEADRYIGVYQTVSVVPGQTYTLTVQGLIRSTEANDGSYGHRMQWGIDPQGGTDWEAVSEWIDLTWDDQPFDLASPEMGSYATSITAESESLTLFIRGWSKWPVKYSRSEFFVDNASLTGLKSGAVAAAEEDEETAQMPPTGGDRANWIPFVGVGIILLLALWEARGVLLWWRRGGTD
ncbi:MAG: hypothetical protein SVX38_04030 [Chloroflexota bacterium]|nr:hypothetical protein [Chloroflexota bacterium]